MRFYTPISMSALNAHIDANLILPAAGLNQIQLSANNGGLDIYGGLNVAGAAAKIQLVGCDGGGGSPGRFRLSVPNAAENADVTVMDVIGCSDTPYLNMLAHRISGVLDPTAAQDALTHHNWADWTPTLVWTGGTPSGLTTNARYLRIGNTIFFVFSVASADSNACTNLTISIPVTTAATIVTIVPAYQRYGVAGTTFAAIFGYIDPADDLIHFADFHTGTDNQAVGVNVSGFYEVA